MNRHRRSRETYIPPNRGLFDEAYYKALANFNQYRINLIAERRKNSVANKFNSENVIEENPNNNKPDDFSNGDLTINGEINYGGSTQKKSIHTIPCNQQGSSKNLEESPHQKEIYEGKENYEINSANEFKDVNKEKTLSISDWDKLIGYRNLPSLIIGYVTEIEERPSKFFNTNKIPMKFSNGTFRSTNVTLRKIYSKSNWLEAFGFSRDCLNLKKFRHPNIALLMALAVEIENTPNCMLIQSFECTLNDFIYKEDQRISLFDCIIYIEQIVNAALYIIKSGYIHSNISSHSILLNRKGKCVKLACFELVTEVQTNIKIEIIISPFYIEKKRRNFDIEKTFNDKIPLKYLPYYTIYRNKFSKCCYQPPEFITTKSEFVFPTEKTEIFSIVVLLWEMIHGSMPFEAENFKAMETLYNSIHDQVYENKGSKSDIFKTLFIKGLQINKEERLAHISLVKNFVEKIKYKLYSKKYEIIEETSTPVPEKVLSPLTIKSVIYPRNSTPKEETLNKHEKQSRYESFEKSKNLGEKFFKSLKLYPKNTKTKTLQSTENSNFVHINTLQKDFSFDIDDTSLPKTTFAKKNKIRRNTWLSDKNISKDILHHKTNENFNTLPKFSATKKYNISIQIVQKRGFKGAKLVKDTHNQLFSPSNVSEKIAFWNAITISKKELATNKNNQSSKTTALKEKESDLIAGFKNHDSSIKITKSVNDCEFENSYWIKEKNICEQDMKLKQKKIQDNINNTTKKLDSYCRSEPTNKETNYISDNVSNKTEISKLDVMLLNQNKDKNFGFKESSCKADKAVQKNLLENAPNFSKNCFFFSINVAKNCPLETQIIESEELQSDIEASAQYQSVMEKNLANEIVSIDNKSTHKEECKPKAMKSTEELNND